ncbi:hypothetical protein BZA05DRAFT_438474 [Tricharina praecox]|uniref:uncharacterized protein n=1 Tax=Tricharina praecox TaxID=43433 RepID=UPI00221FB313|nr:uncharacterized protein BZA05DRAFT_438474 [Tricharina praecox]KAI5845987.1 hypothetical protein BZA05DRAFT_438474 [Tricharina praecox]
MSTSHWPVNVAGYAGVSTRKPLWQMAARKEEEGEQEDGEEEGRTAARSSTSAYSRAKCTKPRRGKQQPGLPRVGSRVGENDSLVFMPRVGSRVDENDSLVFMPRVGSRVDENDSLVFMPRVGSRVDENDSLVFMPRVGSRVDENDSLVFMPRIGSRVDEIPMFDSVESEPGVLAKKQKTVLVFCEMRWWWERDGREEYPEKATKEKGTPHALDLPNTYSTARDVEGYSAYSGSQIQTL